MNSIDENGFNPNIESKYWVDHLNDREKKELEFAEMYAESFQHGTDGHHRLMLIAKLSAMLEAYAEKLELI